MPPSSDVTGMTDRSMAAPLRSSRQMLSWSPSSTSAFALCRMSIPLRDVDVPRVLLSERRSTTLPARCPMITSLPMLWKVADGRRLQRTKRSGRMIRCGPAESMRLVRLSDLLLLGVLTCNSVEPLHHRKHDEHRDDADDDEYRPSHPE